MSNTQKKEKMSVVKKMIIALIGGLAVGLIFMFIRSSMLESGNEGAWGHHQQDPLPGYHSC